MRLAVGWAQLLGAALMQTPFKGAHCGPQTSIRSAKLQEPPANMKLSAEDKHNVKAIWEHVKGHEEALGAEALCRMFTSLPTTRTYFPSKDLKEGSSFLHSHGKKVMGALTNAVAHIDDIDGALSKLSDKHAEELMVDPVNFQKLAHNILVVFGIHLKPQLTCAVHCSVDKFLATVGYVLASKYR